MNDFNREFPNIRIDYKKTNDAGKKATTITEVQDRVAYKSLIDGLLLNPALVIT